MTKTYTFDNDLVSDLHKDAYGFRPSSSFWSAWAAFNADQKQAMWDSLINTAEAEAVRERQQRQEAEHRFQATIASLMHTGARDFDMALRWLHEAHDTQGDDDYLEYQLGVGYGYIRMAREAAQHWNEAA